MPPMARDFGAQLRAILTETLPKLEALSDEHWRTPPKPDAWTPQQELGHLLDSAAHNRLRFARAALLGAAEDPGYEQAEWVKLHGYEQLPPAAILNAWHYDNLLLAHLLDRLPEAAWDAPCTIAQKPPITTQAIAESYLRHLRHHVEHILA